MYLTNVDSYLSHSAQHYPDKIAVVDQGGTRSTTFSELNELAARLGSQLITWGCERTAVLLVLPKSMEALACMAGVTKSNNFYTYFDEAVPLERLHKIITVLQPQVIITTASYHERDNLQNLAPKAHLLAFDSIPALPIDTQALKQRRLSQIDTDLLYVLFTSGSTGTPKGVSISHRSVIDYTEWLSMHFGFTNESVFLNQAPFYFDNSVLDIYSTFKAGATLHLIESSMFMFPSKVTAYIAAHHVTTIFWVPAVLCYFANTNVLQRKQAELSSLNQIIFAGEAMPNKQLNIWRRALPHCTYTNLYGPTEITVDCAYFDVTRDFADDEILPIGFACANTQLLVFNSERKLITAADVGHKGELFVRGSSLALGYYGDETKTAAAFIQNPLNHHYRDLLYATGDIVAYNERGELVFYGRADGQIKYQGHRIELGEIEAVVAGHPEVAACACVFLEHITLFYQSSTGAELNLKSYLQEQLPSYMIPSQFIPWPHFEVNANGKIDRLKLKTWLSQQT